MAQACAEANGMNSLGRVEQNSGEFQNSFESLDYITHTDPMLFGGIRLHALRVRDNSVLWWITFCNK